MVWYRFSNPSVKYNANKVFSTLFLTFSVSSQAKLLISIFLLSCWRQSKLLLIHVAQNSLAPAHCPVPKPRSHFQVFVKESSHFEILRSALASCGFIISCQNFSDWRVAYTLFSSVQSLSCVRLFATPWIAAHQAFLSTTNSWSSLRLMSIESVMPSSHLILCCPLLLLPSIPPRSKIFSSESTLCMSWPKYWSFSFSIIPSKEHPGLISFRMDLLDLLAVQGTLKTSPTPQFKSISSSVLSFLHSPTLTSIHDYWKNHSLD